MLTASDIRSQFLAFFRDKHGHAAVPSSPVVPLDDPTLMFANAGMNQFKDVFLGTGSRPYTRAVDTQKCIRAGGKHNDLDDVGKDTYHHTFFEMLGNWSFGDYFKRDAIAWAWELLTDVWGIDKERLHVTVFEGDPDQGLERDDEAAALWRDVAKVPAERIHLGSKKDNFWEMGNTGPCGPCTEIHIDRTPDKSGGKLVNAGAPEVMEIWNLVFIQYNRGPDGKLTPLPAKHVDTGMGFERIASVLQGKDSNYDTDVFTPIFAAIQEVTGAPAYGGKLDSHADTAYRVIADHIRLLVFAITDGATPSNTQRGYVLRSVLRRAERYGWQHLGTKAPFLHTLVPTVVSVMGDAFPELKRAPERIAALILDEEASFLATLERGIKLFSEAAAATQKAGTKTISGKVAFDLHTEQGVFVEITDQMAAEAGLTVDRPEYERLLKEFKAKSGEQRKKQFVTAIKGDLPKTDDAAKFAGQPLTAKLLGWVRGNEVTREGKWASDEQVALLFDRTPFYGEQGGQAGDVGTVATATGRFLVEDTQRLGDAVVHLGQMLEGTLEVGQEATLELSPERFDIARNHTATHLMNLALRDVLGDHVEQKGSLVDADKTRFDFTHNAPLTADEIARIEDRVNAGIRANLPVTAEVVPLAEAKKLPGVRAVFGEKYPDPVRVVMIGAETPAAVTRDLSTEFCGGTHVARTGEAGLFKLVAQEPVSKGVRRVTALTGAKAFAAFRHLTGVVGGVAETLGCAADEVPARVAALKDEAQRLHKEVAKGQALQLAEAADRLYAAAEVHQGVRLVAGVMPAASLDLLRAQIDRLRQRREPGVFAFGSVNAGVPNLMIGTTDDVAARGVQANAVLAEAVPLIDGKGGGKPTLAQAGGKNAAGLEAALAKAVAAVKAKLG